MKNSLNEFLKQHGIPKSQEVKGSLYLRSLTSIPEGFNPTVGGHLDLRSLTSIPEGFNPTVGGSLYLESLTNEDRAKVKVNCNVPEIRVFKQAQKGNGWIYVDGIITHVKDIEHKISGYTFIVGKIPGMNLITDGKYWAHCDTLRNGIIDLRFKAADHDKSEYENLTLDSVLSYEDAVVLYRVITGACRAGTQAFLNTLAQIKDEYTVREIIEITDGQYNSDAFKKFFANR